MTSAKKGYSRAWIKTILTILILASPPDVAAAPICFSKEEFKRLERLKIKARAQRLKIKALMASIARYKKIITRIKPCPPCPPCKCIIPWLTLGVVAGGCTAGLIAIGVSK